MRQGGREGGGGWGVVAAWRGVKARDGWAVAGPSRCARQAGWLTQQPPSPLPATPERGYGHIMRRPTAAAAAACGLLLLGATAAVGDALAPPATVLSVGTLLLGESVPLDGVSEQRWQCGRGCGSGRECGRRRTGPTAPDPCAPPTPLLPSYLLAGLVPGTAYEVRVSHQSTVQGAGVGGGWRGRRGADNGGAITPAALGPPHGCHSPRPQIPARVTVAVAAATSPTSTTPRPNRRSLLDVTKAALVAPAGGGGIVATVRASPVGAYAGGAAPPENQKAWTRKRCL